MNKEKVIFAGTKDINASYKDLAAVCDYIRYKNTVQALEALEEVISGGAAVYFRTNNSGMGSRHELGGRKGRYPKKCAALVKKTLGIAISNAKGKGMDPDSMFVVHAAANKTQIFNRTPSKGMLYHNSSYGYGTLRRSDVEFAKVEIGIAMPEDIKLGSKATKLIKINQSVASKMAKPLAQKAKVLEKPKNSKAKVKQEEPSKESTARQSKPSKADALPDEKSEQKAKE